MLNPIKPATTYEEQVMKMKERGLVIRDEYLAIQVLRRVNYYRFTGYLLPYKLSTDNYVSGTTFEQIYKIYEFDQSLRNMLSRQLENIEISMRTKLSYHLAHKYGPLGYEIVGNFRPTVDKEGNSLHSLLILRLQTEFRRAVNKGQLFAIHHHSQYGGRLPIWVAVELMSFGDISTLYSVMRQEDQDAISQTYFGLKAEYLVSWLKMLRYIRNTCAHYERLYDLTLETPPKLHRRERSLFPNQKVFSSIFVCCRLLDSSNTRDYFVQNLDALFETFRDVINSKITGFPESWQEILAGIKLSNV